MNKLPFVMNLKNALPAAEWPWALAALRQDACLWRALETTGLGAQALQTLAPAARAWTPAALAGLALELPVSLTDLQALPLAPLPPAWQARLEPALEPPAPETPAAPTSDLPQAGLHALALRERYRQKSSWRAALSAAGLDQPSAPTALACLVGLLPEDSRLLHSLAQVGDGRPRPDLALHALLCQPWPPEVFAQRLNELLGELPPAYGLALLKALGAQRPRLAQRLAQRFLADHASVWAAPAADSVDLGERFYRLAGSLRLAQAHQLAADPDRAVPLLAEALRDVRRLRGHLSAHLAQAMALAQGAGDDHWSETAQETGLEAWKQAVQLAPETPEYAAGFVRSLTQAGRLAEARAYLEKHAAECERCAGVALAAAQAAVRLDRLPEAARQAQQALSLAQAGQRLSALEYLGLARLFQQVGLPVEAAAAARLGLEAYPLHGDLLAYAASAEASLDRPEQALADASLALAAAELNEPLPDRLALHAVLIQALESVGAWEYALDERSARRLDGEPPDLAELRALMYCAERANRPDQAAAAARQALALAPDDLAAHRSLGQAALALGDPAAAAPHLAAALRLAPDQAPLWSALAQAYRQSGQPDQALEALRQASQALPDQAQFHLDLGEVYQSQGGLAQALACFRRAASLLAEQPGHALARRAALDLGSCLLGLGRLDEARRVLEPAWRAVSAQTPPGAVAIPGANLELAYTYAQSLLGLGEPAPAIPLLSEVTRQRPEAPAPCLDLAQALLQVDEQPAGAERAIPFLRRALDLAQDAGLRAEARARLAEACAAAGQWEQAILAYRLALDEPLNREPARQARLSTGLGLAALKLDQPEMAVAALQEAAQTQPLNPALQRALSEAYLANGLLPDAFAAAQAVSQVAPNDLDSLIWFADQAGRIAGRAAEAGADRPAGLSLPQAQARLAQALERAVALAPRRADLLLRLGRLRLERGEAPAALEAYRGLADSAGLARLPGVEIQQAARQVCQMGEGRLGARLLEAILPGGPDAPGAGATPPARLAGLYADLAQARALSGDPQAALQAIDQALGLDDDAPGLHAAKADLLLALDQPQAALDSLQDALQRAPHSPELRYKLAEGLRRAGRLAAALEQVEQGLGDPSGPPDPALERALNGLAAGLAQASLRPRQALACLQRARTGKDGRRASNDPGGLDFDQTALWAEAALDLDDLGLAEPAVEALLALDADHPRTQAAAARRANRRGDWEECSRRCQGARRALIQSQMNQTPITPPATRTACTDAFLAVAQASLEAREWDEALATLNRLIEIIPEAPLAYFRLGQALTGRAEAQRLCVDLDVTRHAPGPASLSGEAGQQAARSFAQAQALLGLTGAPAPGPDERRQTMALWLARGQAVFQPTPASAAALQELLAGSAPGDPASLAALLSSYRHSGMGAAAVAWAQTRARPVDGAPDPLRRPLALAQLALARTDPRQALADVAEALNAASSPGDDWPDEAMLHYLHARLALQSGAPEAAAPALGRALAAWPDEPRWQELASRLVLNQPAPDPVKALLHLEQAAALDPERAETYLMMGRIYLDGGQTPRAIQAFEQAVHLDSARPEGTRPETWLALAQAQAAGEDWEQAAASAEKAALRAADPAPALLLRGQIALQSNNPRGALSRAQAALRAKPDCVEALYLIARALEALDRPAEALKALERALATGMGGLSMQVERVRLLRRSAGLEAGLPALQALLAAHPNQPDLLAQLAAWLAEAGRGEAAVQAARQALQEGAEVLPDPQRASLHTLIGLSMRRAGQLDQAIQHLSEAAAAAPANLDILLELGRAYQERREYKLALKTYQRAMNATDHDYRPYYQAGLALKDSKDYMAAEAMLRRAAQLAPEEVSVHRLLGAVVTLNLVHNHKLAAAD